MSDSVPDAAFEAPSARKGLRAAVYRYLEATPASFGPRLVQMGIMAVILLSVGSVVVGTVQAQVAEKWIPLEEVSPGIFQAIEFFCLGVFTAEYLLRIWCITADGRYAQPFLGRLRYALTPLCLIDLLAILPSYFAVGGFIAARAFRLVRIFRIFKLGHYSTAVRSLHRAFVLKRAELGITVFVILILLVLFSTLVYYVENDAQPDKFSSIPATMWWGIVTLTTVGYGDISPVTPLGKLAGGIVAIFGIGLVALPAGILGSAFMEALGEAKAPRRCPHCGKEIGSSR